MSLTKLPHKPRRLPAWVLLGAAALMIVGITAILSLEFIRGSVVDVTKGIPAPQQIDAPQQKSFVSELLTEQAREFGISRVSNVYTPIDRSIGRNQIQAATAVFDFIHVVRDDTLAGEDWKLSTLQQIELITLDLEMAERLLLLSADEIEIVETRTLEIIDELMREQVRDSDLPGIPEKVKGKIGIRLGSETEAMLSTLVPELIAENSFYDEAKTLEARQAASDAVEPVTQNVLKDQVILRRGEIVTDEKLEMLTELGLLQRELNPLEIGRNALLSLVAAIIIFLYFIRYRHPSYERRRFMLLLTGLLLLFVLSAELLVPTQTTLSYLFPAAALAMLISFIFDIRFAVIVSLVLSLIVGYAAGGSLEFTLYTLFGSLIAIFTLQDAQRISAFFRAGFFVMLANLLVMAIFNFTPTSDPFTLAQLALFAVANGILTAAVALVGVYLIGLFGITTMLQLQDLSRFDQPLLTELLHLAPGTYHHSTTVAMLAEQACERIGANGLLARVGAFYHDIGKMAQSPYFTENQEGPNPHDNLPPHDSAAIIIGHVTGGVKLAQKHRLPERMQDFIREHHGTQVLGYFYQKACESVDIDPPIPIPLINKDDFRYPGPRPQSRETGIVMMADAVEATSKAVQPNNEIAIEKLVNKIIDGLVTSGQLDQSGLSLSDIRIVRDSFAETLNGRFHVRVKYAGNDELIAANTPDAEQS